MSLPIPLLDRPSAVGDEGRPRETSLAVVSIVVAALAGVTGYLIGQLDLVVTLTTVAGPAAAGMALLDRDRFVHQFFGHALLSWFGWALALVVVGGPLYNRAGVAVAGFAVTLFALTATWSDAADHDSLRRAVHASGRTYVATWLWLTAVLVVSFLAALAIGGVAIAAGAGGPATAAFGFCVVVACSASAVVLGLRWLPVEQLTPRPKRETVAAHVETVRTGAVGTAVAAIGFAALVVALWLAGVFAGLAVRAPLVATALEGLAAWPVVGPVAAVGATVLLGGLLSLCVRTAAARTASPVSGRLAAGLAALPMALVLLVVIAAVVWIPFVGALLAIVVALSPLILVLLLAVAHTAAERRVVPDRAGGPALAALGLLVAAAGLAAIAELLAFACVAAALLVWDVSTYGLGVTAELGHRPDTRRLELVHGVLSVGVAIAAVALVAGLNLLRTAAAGDLAGAVPAVVACLGVLLLVAPLRG